MDDKQAARFGAFIAKARQAKDMSQVDVGKAAGMSSSTVVRIEQGKFSAPRADKLARIAAVLDVPLADVFAAADYAVPDELPNFSHYMYAKYGQLLDDTTLQRIDKYVLRIARQEAGIDLNRPPETRG